MFNDSYDGFGSFNKLDVILYNASLSKQNVIPEQSNNLCTDNVQLYGSTTVSLIDGDGTTENVVMI